MRFDFRKRPTGGGGGGEGELHETRTNSHSYGLVSLSIHSVSCVYMGPAWTGLKTNSEWSDFVSVADPTRVIFLPV